MRSIKDEGSTSETSVRVKSLKTIPWLAARPRIANIGEYFPPPGSSGSSCCSEDSSEECEDVEDENGSSKHDFEKLWSFRVQALQTIDFNEEVEIIVIELNY
ncbi:hypothetical protein AC249_AIPGENE20529 [Exaiptasia diaphana]|nr:hypothetical protein AC249_AIPGENE20529 [Exaiptasia diaphana]